MVPLLSRELGRKAFHIAGSLIPIGYYFFIKETAIIALTFVNAILLIFEWLRLNRLVKVPETIMRSHENDHVAAYIYFQMAALVSIIIFEKTIAIAAILMLAIGDAASGVAGTIIKGGNVRQSNDEKAVKPFSIMVIIFIVCTVIGAVLVNLPLADDMIYVPFYVYVAGALGATMGDTVPFRIKGIVIDDNFMIPLLSGAFMTIAMI